MRVAGLTLCCGAASAGEPAGNAEWLSHCGQNLASRHLGTPAVQTYCSCVAGLGDDAEMLTWDQKELEKSFPYAHVRCVDRAAQHRGDAK